MRGVPPASPSLKKADGGDHIHFLTKYIYQNGRKTPSFSYGDISPLSVKSSMDIDRKKFTLSIELDKHIQYNLNHEI